MLIDRFARDRYPKITQSPHLGYRTFYFEANIRLYKTLAVYNAKDIKELQPIWKPFLRFTVLVHSKTGLSFRVHFK